MGRSDSPAKVRKRADPGFIKGVRLALRSLREDRRATAPGRATGRPIVLIHGFGSSSRVLQPLERHLRRALNRPVVRMRLGGRIHLHLSDIRESSRKVHRVIERMARKADFEHVDVVGHSMGGLVATYLLKQLDRGRHVRHVVTLGTPHRGTSAAYAGILLAGALSRAIWQMRPKSPLLEELGASTMPRGSRLISIAAEGDDVVPLQAARLPAGGPYRNLVLDGLSHWELLASSRAFTVVSDILGG